MACKRSTVGVGFGWNNDMMCGNMNLSITLENQLNGATQGFQNIMGSVIQNATGAVMSLPALIIQRANPQLYNLMVPMVASQKCALIRPTLCIRSRPQSFGIMW